MRYLPTIFGALALAVLGCDTTICEVTAPDGKKYECDSNATSKCEDLIQAFCVRTSECSIATSVAACKGTANLVLDCDAAIAVTDDYGQCLDDIEDESCNWYVLGTSLPGTCEDAILVEAGNGGSGGGGGGGGGGEEDAEEPGEEDVFAPNPDADEYWLVEVEVTIADENADGDSWDGWGAGDPDIFFVAIFNNVEFGESSTKDTGYSGHWTGLDFQFEDDGAGALTIKFYDEDLTSDDHIGTVNIAGGDLDELLSSGSLTLFNPPDQLEYVYIRVVED